jgi:formylglycine-generating enzyme required for sulfatase activity
MRTGMWIAFCPLLLAGVAFTVQAAEPAAALSVSGHRIGEIFRDCRDVCPEMVVIPPGHFQMGSPNRRNDEAPVHEVHIGYVFAVSKYPVTRGEWRQYVAATHHPNSNYCISIQNSGKNWLEPGFTQDDNHPVVCVSWDEAKGYVSWLSQKTGQHYRLLSESEYEYINRAGTSTEYFWGDKWDRRRANGGEKRLNGADGPFQTSPVGSFQPNGFGLYDTTGNVDSWTQDCWHDNYSGAPTDGSAWTVGDCSKRVFRGGTFTSASEALRAAFHYRGDPGKGLSVVGFRLARTNWRAQRAINFA